MLYRETKGEASKEKGKTSVGTLVQQITKKKSTTTTKGQKEKLSATDGNAEIAVELAEYAPTTNNVVTDQPKEEVSLDEMQSTVAQLSSKQKILRISVWFAGWQQMCASLLVDAVVWLILFPPLTSSESFEPLLKDILKKKINNNNNIGKGLLSWDSIDMHVLNAIMIYLDFIVGKQPFEFHAVSFVLLLAFVYAMWSWCVHAIWHFWPYPFLDTSVPFNGVMYFIVAAMHFLLWFVVRFFHRWREEKFHPWILKRRHAESNQMMQLHADAALHEPNSELR
ncbi:hypothetical protein RFI_03199 [Reticulomyxa filosa]|uniref:Transmembrane protein n=1 Tax=Reticulomyxa filosa TaxID=46433 RepID=X6P772_RETFI|nr:hypothetical protein RFI_03199 [Reticulomyxa filosa]|eukprot:ETO33899.1 hypothetical protein RFI_03199 [Reticulomyxa filosa]